MGKSKLRLSSEDVLCYSDGARRSANTIRRHYYNWRANQIPPIPERCDNKKCYFYSEPLHWNGFPLKPILDHKNGVNTDNRPKNLRLLCPNCDSQNRDTRGGANKNKVEKSSGGFARTGEGGKRNYVMPVNTGNYIVSSNNKKAKTDVSGDIKKHS